MKFEEAWDLAWNATPPENRPRKGEDIGVIVAKTLAMSWSMMANAVNSDGKILLDDMAYISHTNSAISVPLQKSVSTSKKTVTKKAKAKDDVENPDGAKK